MENILDWSQAVLSTTSARWENLARSLPEELLRHTPAEGEWCALECLQHLVDTEKVFVARLGFFRRGQDFPAFDPERQGTQLDSAVSPFELAARFARMRMDSLLELAAVTPGELGRRVRHAELGPVMLGEMVYEWAAHDLNHTVQAERAVMQPFILGSGPWKAYFQDHLVKRKISSK